MWMVVTGADFLMAVGSVFVSTLALPEEQSVAGAVFQTLVQLGGALGLAFVGVVQSSVMRREAAKGADYITSLLKGLHGAFWFGAGTSFAALIIAVVVLRGMGTYGGKTKKGESESEMEVEPVTSEASTSDGKDVRVVEKGDDNV